MKLSKCTG